MEMPRILHAAARPLRFALVLVFAAAQPVFGGPEFDAAVALFDHQQFTEARAALEKLAVEEPKNAAVCYFLGRVIAKGPGEKSDADSVPWLAKAVEFDPKNATYAETYGRTLLRVASRTRSLTGALKGRDFLERAVTLDPALLSAHELLWQFYHGAPWPIGSSAKAKAHIDAIRHADPGRGVELELLERQPEARDHLSDAAIAQAATPEARRQLRILRAVIEPVSPVALAQVAGDRAFLSDVIWIDAKVGWGKPARNHYWFDEQVQDAVFLKLDGKVFEKGLFAHAPSRYAFALDARWKTLSATIGLRDGALAEGSVVFIVRGDGRELYRSPIMRPGASRPVEVDISGVQELELLTEGGEGHNHHAWSIWVDLLVRR